MDLSVIIVCYRGWKPLTDCLESLERIGSGNFSMEVIIVDNNSADGKIGELEKRFSGFRFIKSSINGGFGYGCNLGAENSSGDVILFLNPDTVVNEHALSALLERTRREHSHYIVSCRQVRNDGKETRAEGLFPGDRSHKKGKIQQNGSVRFPDWVSGSVMMMRREVFKNLGGFDERFWMYYEDVDICKRVANEGVLVVFYTDIAIQHNHGGSSRINRKTAALTKSEVQASRHLYFHKHFNGIRRIKFQVFIILDNLITGIIAGLSGVILFFVPKLFVRFLLSIKLLEYYTRALVKGSWISKRSVINLKSLTK
jgi:GT2 family glycosyltransferase